MSMSAKNPQCIPYHRWGEELRANDTCNWILIFSNTQSNNNIIQNVINSLKSKPNYNINAEHALPKGLKKLEIEEWLRTTQPICTPDSFNGSRNLEHYLKKKKKKKRKEKRNSTR